MTNTNNDNIRLEQISEDIEAQRHSLNEQGQRLDRIETILTSLVTEIKIYDSKLDGTVN